jgi:hypothetical protein
LVALLAPWIAKLRGFRLHQTDFRIASERTELTVYSLGTGETAIKHRDAIDSTAADAQATRLWINSTEREILEGYLCTEVPG